MTRRPKKLLSSIRRQHTDGEKYTVYVFWVMGHTERVIARVMGLRPKQIAGIIAKSEYRNRSEMTDLERQAKLVELEDIRFEDGIPLDGGILSKVVWGILPLQGKQKKGS